VDGHAPGLMGEKAKKYIEAGISTDHECFTREEALDKIKHGMKIIIREGSAAKNYDALIDLLNEYPDLIMFCSDDKHPNELILGHINLLVKRSIAHGIDPMKVLRAASLNPIKHYGLDIGLLQEGDPADFIVADNLSDLTILKTYINGLLVASSGDTLIQSVEEGEINNFNCQELNITDIELIAESPQIKVIEALDGQLITNQLNLTGKVREGKMVSDPENDILKMIVHNRYQPASPSIAFVKNFGLKSGAIASTVAHDSHNIIAVGVSDEDIINAVNLLIKSQGGVSLVSDQIDNLVKLPVAGLMSVADGYLIADEYGEIDQMAKDLGASLSAPYMTLSFLALLVIPKLKLSDKGLFDGETFSFTSNFNHP
jgi:adenine deaminase